MVTAIPSSSTIVHAGGGGFGHGNGSQVEVGTAVGANCEQVTCICGEDFCRGSHPIFIGVGDVSGDVVLTREVRVSLQVTTVPAASVKVKVPSPLSTSVPLESMVTAIPSSLV